MDMNIGTFFGLSLTVGTLTTAITQLVKLTENIPGIDKIPGVRALLDTIVEGGHLYEKRLFVAIVSLVLSIIAVRLDTGAFPTLDLQFIFFSFKSFFDATAGYHLLLDKGKKSEIIPAE